MKFQCTSYLEIYDVNLVIDFRKLKNAEQKNKRRLCFVFINLVWTKTTLLFIVFRPGLGFESPDQSGHTEFFFFFSTRFGCIPGSGRVSTLCSCSRFFFEEYMILFIYAWYCKGSHGIISKTILNLFEIL
jgi:hypothetical protein